jgi:hypothetical protein
MPYWIFRYISFWKNFISFRFDRFRFVSFDFVSFDFVSFRFYFVSHFTCTLRLQGPSLTQHLLTKAVDVHFGLEDQSTS